MVSQNKILKEIGKTFGSWLKLAFSSHKTASKLISEDKKIEI